MANQLPTYGGYTVDVRLGEFRKADLETGLECVPFESEQGRELLKGLISREIEVYTYTCKCVMCEKLVEYPLCAECLTVAEKIEQEWTKDQELRRQEGR